MLLQNQWMFFFFLKGFKVPKDPRDFRLMGDQRWAIPIIGEQSAQWMMELVNPR